MDFSSTFYSKFKSKLFSIEADRYMAEKVLKLGTKNITKLKESIREEPMFRFDHYFRTRNET
jgi:SWI/SNF-related matrix-associated actin-dependent regulator of chromatin subfamily A member 5